MQSDFSIRQGKLEGHRELSLLQRSVTSISWNLAVSGVWVVVGAIRSILLARWLSVEVFGVYRLAGSIITLSATVAGFGMAGAFLHRSRETADEDRAASVFLTLVLILSSIWALILLVATQILAKGEIRTALFVLIITQMGALISMIPHTILVRRVCHRRLALIQLADIILSSAVALILAWQQQGIWALLSTNLVTLLLNVSLLYLWHPVWRPHLTWAPEEMKYFLRFGSRNLAASLLLQALDRVDDLWTGFVLGDQAMGFYSRAFTFASYPRMILASSVNKVAGGSYAELKEQRRRLSQAFFRINALLIRSGFFLAGVLALLAPEFIVLAIGEKWLPMLSTFRLMLIFTLLDPIKITVGNLFVAVGKPEQVVQARVIQLIVLVLGLASLGSVLGIEGVALAVNVMLVVGITILLVKARTYVDFSVRRLFAAPALALVLGLALAQLGVMTLFHPTTLIFSGLLKLALFSIPFGAILCLLERQELGDSIRMLKQAKSQ